MKQKIRAVSKAIARMPVKTSGLMVDHPFLGPGITLEEVEKRIDECENAKQIAELVNPVYRAFWLHMCRDCLTRKEYSQLLRYTGCRKPEMLEDADKEYLMSRSEYAKFKKTPATMTLYSLGDLWCRSEKRAKEYARLLGEEVRKIRVSREDVLCYCNSNGEDAYVVRT